MSVSAWGVSAVRGQARCLRQELTSRAKWQLERLRRMVLLRLFGCSPKLRYLAAGLVNRSLARLARPGRRPALPLGRELEQRGYCRLPGRLDPAVVEAIRREFATGLADPAAVRDLMRRDENGGAQVARRNLTAPWQRLPSLARLLDGRLQAELADYFGSDFYVSMVEAYRTYGVPAPTKGIFGRFMTWHLDCQQWSDVVKLFVPLEPVEADQGPTEVLDKASSLALSRVLARRLGQVDDREVEARIEALGRSEAMTVPAGEGYLVETQYCFHRAGIPQGGRTRDLLVVRLRPWSRLVAPGALAKGRVGRLEPRRRATECGGGR